MDILAKFGKRVREERTALGLSQEAFADKCKLDRTYISGIERGKRNVALRNKSVPDNQRRYDVLVRRLGDSPNGFLTTTSVLSIRKDLGDCIPTKFSR